MRFIALGLALLLSLESAATACSCAPPSEESPLDREVALELAATAVVIAEFEVAEDIDHGRGTGELLRPVRYFVGEERKEYRIERPFQRTNDGKLIMMPSSCASHLVRGQRTILALHPAGYERPSDERVQLAYGAYRNGNLECIRSQLAAKLERKRDAAPSSYRDAGGCVQLFLQSPAGLHMVLEEAEKLGRDVRP